MATLSKNMLWSTLTSILQLYTGSVIFIVLAKIMNLNDFGVLSFGFSLAALVAVAADFGFSLMIIKDFPQVNESQKGEYIFNSIMAKLALSILGSLLFSAYLYYFYDNAWLIVGFIYILIAVGTSFVTYFQAFLRVENKFKEYSQTVFVYAFVITLCIIWYWVYEVRLIELVIGLAVCRFIQLGYTLYISKLKLFLFSFSFLGVKKLLVSSWSFGLHMLLGIFYFMCDTQIISLFYGASEVALYQSVFRIILILLLCSDIISNVLLPYLSFKFHRKENITKLVSKISLYLLLIGCSLFLLFTTFERQILDLLYTSEYKGAIILVLPFSIVIILRTVSSLMGNILTISDKQRYRVLTVAVSLFISLTLNLYFIPKYGIISAAWISVVVHFVLFSMYYYYSKKVVPSLHFFNFTNTSLLASTAIIYYFIHISQLNTYITNTIGIVSWISIIFIVMKRNNNYIFLQQILKEKGTG